ncbi:threonine-phosphate decarboxylase CobD [Phreatobacter sp. HK31-P]
MQHGGDLTTAMAVHGGTREAWLDLSTGINPFAWPVPRDLPVDAWTSLPTRGALDRLLAAARRAYAVRSDVAILAAPGTQSLIQWLPQLAPDGPVAIVQPTYAEHALAWRRAGHEVIGSSPAMPLPDAVRHLVIVNPNNPDGHLFGQDTLADLAAAVAKRGGWLVVDESFIDVTPEASAVALCADRPVLILRSFGKFYGLAGLRLGFLIARPAIAEPVAEAFGPWSVAGPALEIGAAALADAAYALMMRSRLTEEAVALDAVLQRAGLDVVGGTTLFRLVRHPAARKLHAALARGHIWVRRFDWDDQLLRFGLPPGDEARQRLAAALADGLAEAHVGDQGTRTGCP